MSQDTHKEMPTDDQNPFLCTPTEQAAFDLGACEFSGI
jgi:hypothetical protein